MNDRRVLTFAVSREHADKRHAYYKERDETAQVEQVNGQWAVTAAKTKKEGR